MRRGGETRVYLGDARRGRLEYVADALEMSETELLKVALDRGLAAIQAELAAASTPSDVRFSPASVPQGGRGFLASASSPLGRVGENREDFPENPPSLPSILPTTVDNSPGGQECPRSSLADTGTAGAAGSARPTESAPPVESAGTETCTTAGSASENPAPGSSQGSQPEPDPSRATTTQPGDRPESPGRVQYGSANDGKTERCSKCGYSARPEDFEEHGRPRQCPECRARQPVTDASSFGRKPKKAKAPRPVVGPRFEAFWAAWPPGPRKVRSTAEKAWQRLVKSQALPDVFGDGRDPVLLALEWAKVHHVDWLKDNGAYIPQPSTWLNQRRWEGVNGLSAPALGLDPPATPTTPARPAWAVDVTAAIGDLGTKLYYAIQDAYPRWPRHGETDPECFRLEALWSQFTDEKDIDKILSLRPAIEAEIAKLEGRDELAGGARSAAGSPEGSSGPGGAGLEADAGKLVGGPPNGARPPQQSSLWRDAPS